MSKLDNFGALIGASVGSCTFNGVSLDVHELAYWIWEGILGQQIVILTTFEGA